MWCTAQHRCQARQMGPVHRPGRLYTGAGIASTSNGWQVGHAACSDCRAQRITAPLCALQLYARMACTCTTRRPSQPPPTQQLYGRLQVGARRLHVVARHLRVDVQAQAQQRGELGLSLSSLWHHGSSSTRVSAAFSIALDSSSVTLPWQHRRRGCDHCICSISQPQPVCDLGAWKRKQASTRPSIQVAYLPA